MLTVALITTPVDIINMFPRVTLSLSPLDRSTVAKGGPPIPVIPCIKPLVAPLINKTYFVIDDFNLHPLEIKITKKITRRDIIIFIICSLIEIKKIIPIGIVNIIEKNIGAISLNLQVFAPIKVKYIVVGISMTILKTIANIGEYKKERIGIVIRPDPKPKKPLINPENKITIMRKKKFEGIK